MKKKHISFNAKAKKSLYINFILLNFTHGTFN